MQVSESILATSEGLLCTAGLLGDFLVVLGFQLLAFAC